jgi:Phage related hypothetical protein (DUF1799)
VLFGLPPNDGADGGASVRRQGPTPEMIKAEGDDLAVMWGGDETARARADDWVAARLKAVADVSEESASGDARSTLSGLPPPLEKNGGLHEAKYFEVDSDNVAAARVFMGMATQWRVTTMSGLAGGLRIKEGLDYTALPVVAAALGQTLDAGCFEGVQTLERATLSLEADAAKRAPPRAPRGRR